MPLKVYYLDDEPALLEIFVDTFASPAVEITTFTDPTAAIACVQIDPPDLIFLDFRLAGTTGVEVAQQLNPVIPKVLITGDIHVEQQSLFQKVFEKPINVNVVQDYINTLLQPI